MNFIHDNKANNIAECNPLHDILNPSKRTKNRNRNYSLIIHVCMNTSRGGYKFNNFRILLDSEFSSIELIAM